MLNHCTFIGNLGADPDIKEMKSGEKLCNLSLGCTERYKDKQGQQQSVTEWVKVTIFNPHLVKVAENYLSKGSKIYIGGAMKTRKWTDSSGVDKYTTEIVLQRFNGELKLLDSKSDGSTFKENVATPKVELNDEIPF